VPGVTDDHLQNPAVLTDDMMGLNDLWPSQYLIRFHPGGRGTPRSINSLLSAMAGYFTEVAARPAFPNSPWMRTHQAWWRDATLSWLALRLQL
jgi:hypothetical protein